MPVLTALGGPLTVQLHQSSGAGCWSATYSPPFLRQDDAVLKDRAD